MIKFFLILILLLSIGASNADIYNTNNIGEDWQNDLSVGGDIFSDFNEDLEASQVMEDERFYRYGRFFTVNVGLGQTSFTGNRGIAYKEAFSPTFHFSLMYFLNFNSTFNIGLEYSSHTMFVDSKVSGSPDEVIGAVTTNLLRPFLGFRYYLDTADLGTAITYSNPYFTGRAEYWYQTNEFNENELTKESTKLSDETGGAIGTAIGLGLEFPMELKKTYFNVEMMYHFVTFIDEFTTQYQQTDDADSTNGYKNLIGDPVTFTATYNFNW